MKGAKWRLLAVKYEDIIIPQIANLQRQELIRSVFYCLVEIQWISYAPPKFQKQRPVRLRLHAVCFLLCLLLEKAYPNLTNEGALYLHTIIKHFPEWYETRDFRNGSCEAGESLFNRMKHIALSFTSRHEDQALLEFFIRLHFERDVKEYCGGKESSDYLEVSTLYDVNFFNFNSWSKHSRNIDGKKLSFLLVCISPNCQIG